MREIVMQLLMWVVVICDYIAYIPQLHKLIKTKRSEDISRGSWILWTISSVCDVTYSVLLGRYELVVAAASGLLLNGLVFTLTAYYSWRTAENNNNFITETEQIHENKKGY